MKGLTFPNLSRNRSLLRPEVGAKFGPQHCPSYALFSTTSKPASAPVLPGPAQVVAGGVGGRGGRETWPGLLEEATVLSGACLPPGGRGQGDFI